MSQPPLPAFPLRPARVHEVFGAAAPAFAAICAAGGSGPVLWVRESWLPETLHPSGLAMFLDPDRLIIASSADQTDSLAVAEEALRDGAVGLVVIEITRPVNLREGRRLQLAAAAGRSTGLCLIREGMGSNAAETRWHAIPVFDPAHEDSTLMRWEITKNKSGTVGAWNVVWNWQANRIDVVSPAGFGPGSAGMSD
ncbi:ImuA family protein [Paracoccus jeotgali]|uniref:ImuA family protein n=1 Tax=Paracoccus jeotgali TaxID=2065379 RepID=UPI0028A91C01|nr:hypothetical protein [Paracoccus jeotgali]